MLVTSQVGTQHFLFAGTYFLFIIWRELISHGRSQDFSKGGSHWFIHRVLTKLSPEYCRLFAYKKDYKGGVTGTPGPPPPWLRPCIRLSQLSHVTTRSSSVSFGIMQWSRSTWSEQVDSYQCSPASLSARCHNISEFFGEFRGFHWIPLSPPYDISSCSLT